MRPRDLACLVIEGLDPDVIRIAGEDPGGLAGRHPAELGHEHLHHEPSVRLQVRGRVGEDRQLIVLGGDVHDRVRHQVHEPEGPRDAGGGHVADGHRDRIGAGLGEQLPEPAFPLAAIFIAIPGALALANLIAVVPGQAAARTQSATVLRTE
jgi:hypothetical protein